MHEFLEPCNHWCSKQCILQRTCEVVTESNISAQREEMQGATLTTLLILLFSHITYATMSHVMTPSWCVGMTYLKQPLLHFQLTIILPSLQKTPPGDVHSLPHAVYRHRPKCHRVARTRTHGSSTACQPVWRRLHVPWGSRHIDGPNCLRCDGCDFCLKATCFRGTTADALNAESCVHWGQVFCTLRLWFFDFRLLLRDPGLLLCDSGLLFCWIADPLCWAVDARKHWWSVIIT